LLGATAGRTTLSGEGLQHADGHSPVLASTNPACQSYDAAFAYELGAIIEHGLHRMYGAGGGEDVFYYLTIYNENYEMPARPDHVTADDIVRGMYLWAAGDESLPHKATILFSGPAHRAARDAQNELATRFGVAADLWSVTSYKHLRDDALATERFNRLHPLEPARTPVVNQLLSGDEPIVAVTDYMKLVPDQISRWVPLIALGTDGYGRSDTRESLRRFFEVDTGTIVVTVLSALARRGSIDAQVVADAMVAFGLDAEAPDPSLP
jgi:pyruvate dehydrogenase E1 component